MKSVFKRTLLAAAVHRQPGNWNELLRTIVTPMARELERMSVPAASAVQDAIAQINASLREFQAQRAGAP